jgi:Dolichyl-phosphate-mannose-protein mannosyltransferase
MNIATLSDRASLLTRANSSGLRPLLLVATTTALLCAPFMRTIYSMGDEGMLLHAAERMLRGATLYLDFFEFAPPGGFVLAAAWFKIAGLSLWSARLLALLSIVGIACFTHLACQRASKNVMLSGLLAISWAVMSQGEWTQVSHHYFTTFFSMVAAWAAHSNIEEERSKLQWPLIAGTAAGAAAMVIPTCGGLAMLAAATAFFNPQRRSMELVIYALGCLLVPIGLLIYLISHHALAAAFDGVIVFAATRYSSIQMVPFGTFVDAQTFPILFLFPAAGLLIALICVRKRRACFHDARFRVCTAFAAAGFAGCFPRPDITHITFVAPLVLPLLAYCVTQLNPSWPRTFRYAVAGVLVALCTPAAISFAGVTHKALRAEITPLPRGNLIILQQPGAAALLARLTTLPSGDAYFFYPYMFMLPFLSGREHVSKYDHFVSGYTTPSQYQEACLSVMHLASWVIIDRKWTDPHYLKLIYPSIRDPRPRETREFERNLDDNFQLVIQEGSFELRHRRADRPEPTCNNISP